MKCFKLLALFTFLSLGFLSCKKESAPIVIDQSQEKLLIGKWNLQQERFTRYIDTVKRIDTTFNTSVYNIAYTQFKIDGTFVSESSYTVPGTFASGSASDGRYWYDGTTFGLSNSMSGLRNGVDFFGTVAGGSAPVITPVSHLSQISLLTSSKLNLHTEFVYTYTVNGMSQTYKMTDDYYFTR